MTLLKVTTGPNIWGICLSEGAVVHCSRWAHTDTIHPSANMSTLPTLLILAEPSFNGSEAHSTVAGLPSLLDSTLQKALASGLPVTLICPPGVAHRARQTLPANDIVVMPSMQHMTMDHMARAIAAGVLASAQAPGWLLLPADMPIRQTETLRKIATNIAGNTVVFPRFRHHPGHPMGFSAELFSELIRISSERDLARLTARYPAAPVDVDDPGVLMSQRNSEPGMLEHLRAALDGGGATALFPTRPSTGTAGSYGVQKSF